MTRDSSGRSPARTVHRQLVGTLNNKYLLLVKERDGSQGLIIKQELYRGVKQRSMKIVIPHLALEPYHQAYWQATRNFWPRPIAFHQADQRDQFPRHGEPWHHWENRFLADRRQHGETIAQLAAYFGRTECAIMWRLYTLGMIQ